MAKFLMKPLILPGDPVTARLGAGTGASNNIDDRELNKLVKLVGESRYNLTADGDEIEGFIYSVEPATLDGYSIGSVQRYGRQEVVADGVQATPGTGTIAVGDYVVTGTVVAKGTALTGAGPKVCKATTQADVKNSPFAWRVVSLGSAGTGAVGTTIVIERV